PVARRYSAYTVPTPGTSAFTPRRPEEFCRGLLVVPVPAVGEAMLTVWAVLSLSAIPTSSEPAELAKWLKPMTSASSQYSQTVQFDSGSERHVTSPQSSWFEWPRPKLWPSSCAVTSMYGAPLMRIWFPLIQATPSQPPQFCAGM